MVAGSNTLSLVRALEPISLRGLRVESRVACSSAPAEVIRHITTIRDFGLFVYSICEQWINVVYNDKYHFWSRIMPTVYFGSYGYVLSSYQRVWLLISSIVGLFLYNLV